ncbi:MAG: addiction module antidote protein [Nitrospiraceae bacterium]
MIESLRNPRETEHYLNAALEENDPELFFLALRNGQRPRAGSQLPDKTKLNRESLYKMLSERGNPELRSLDVLLHALGSASPWAALGSSINGGSHHKADPACGRFPQCHITRPDPQ